MANEIINSFSDEWMKRIKRCVEKSEGNLDATMNRRKRSVVSSGGCEKQNTIWDITIFGAPTNGDITLRVKVNGVTENVVFQWDDDATAAATAMKGHSQIGTSDVQATAGPFPNSTMRVEFIGDLGNQLIDLPTASFGSLDGGNGIGVIVQMAQRGHR